MKPAKIRRAIVRDLEGWRGTFGLCEWTLNYRFHKLKDSNVAQTKALWEYHEAQMVFDVKQMSRRGFTRDDVRRTVLHEMLHCVCNGYERCHGDFMLEELVSKLTTVTVRCWNAPAPKGAS